MHGQVGNGIEHALESSSDEADGPQEDPEEQSQLLWNEVLLFKGQHTCNLIYTSMCDEFIRLCSRHLSCVVPFALLFT